MKELLHKIKIYLNEKTTVHAKKRYQVFPKIFQFNSIDFLISQYKIMPIVVPKAYLRGFY